MKRIAKRLLPVLLIAAATSGVSHADERPMDWIVAIVDAEAITFTELADEMRGAAASAGFSMDGLTFDQRRKLGEDILERILTDSIIEQEARRRGLSIPPAEIDEATEEAVQRVRGQFPDDEAYQRALALEFMTAERLRERYRQQSETSLLRKKLVNQEVRRRVNVTDSAVEAAYVRKKDEVHVRHILVSSQETAKKVRERWLAGDDFDRIGADAGALEAADLGWIQRGRTVPPFEEAAFAVEPETISEIVRTKFGFHVLQVIEKRTVELPPLDDELRENVRNELFAIEFDSRMTEYLDELRARAYVSIKEDYLGPME